MGQITVFSYLYKKFETLTTKLSTTKATSDFSTRTLSTRNIVLFNCLLLTDANSDW